MKALFVMREGATQSHAPWWKSASQQAACKMDFLSPKHRCHVPDNGDLLPAADCLLSVLNGHKSARRENIPQANFASPQDEFFPFCPLRKFGSLLPSLSLPPVICYENVDHKRGGWGVGWEESRTTLLQAISWENCLVNIIMQTNPEKKRGRQPGERDLNM